MKLMGWRPEGEGRRVGSSWERWRGRSGCMDARWCVDAPRARIRLYRQGDAQRDVDETAGTAV